MGVLFGHFMVIGMYSSPLSEKTLKPKAISQAYVYPFFHQDWGLFVPSPKCQFELYYRMKSDSGWSSWNNVFLVVMNKRRNNRLLGHEAEVLLFSNSMNYVCHTLSSVSKCYLKEPQDINFKILKHEVISYIQNDGNHPTTLEILLTNKVHHITTAYYFKNLSAL